MTRRVALIGHPLRRRHSEVMHNAAFDHFMIDARYELHELQPEAISRFVDEARADVWLGFQVTAPYKQQVMEHLDEIEEDAQRIGAVNSVVRRADGSLVGFNTDAEGFRRAAERELGIRFRGLPVCVAGAGGAARAVIHALVSGGARTVTVGNRSRLRARDVADEFGHPVRGVELGAAFDDALARAGLAVNATTVGMIAPRVVFDVSVLPASASVYDLVYDPPESQLLNQARARGLPATNGLGMLVAQAEIAFERWTDVPEAGVVMREALEAWFLRP